VKPVDQDGNELTTSQLSWRLRTRPMAGPGRRCWPMTRRIIQAGEQQIGPLSVSVSWN
jgi:hypothetical protein